MRFKRRAKARARVFAFGQPNPDAVIVAKVSVTA